MIANGRFGSLADIHCATHKASTSGLLNVRFRPEADIHADVLEVETDRVDGGFV